MTWKPDYTTLLKAKEWVRITDTVDDAQLAVWITAASRAVDAKCYRQFGQLAVPAARTYRRPAVYDRRAGLWVVEVDDVQTSTGLTVAGVAYATSGAVLLPDNAPADGLPWTRLGFTACPSSSTPLVVVAQWGWAAVPTQVEAAVWLQLARWNSRRDSPYGVAGSPDQGSEMRLLAKLDPDVATTLTGLSRRPRIG